MASAVNQIKNLVNGHFMSFSSHVALIIVLAAMPFVFSPFIASEILVFGIFAMGYNLLLGYGGELSFGHAAFFGLGAYSTVLLLRGALSNLYLAIAVSVVIVTVISVIFGYISLRRRGIYFAMITLALGQMVYVIVFQWSGLTGGSNGIAIPTVNATIGPLAPLESDIQFYSLALVFFLLIYAVTARIVNSPFGRILKAVRESEERALHLGYDVNNYLLVAFTMSGAISAFAGALYAVLFAFISPNILYWSLSGEIVLMTIIGGIGTLTGPLAGAVVFIFLSDTLTQVTEHWQVIFGLFIIAVVILSPEGLIGSIRSHIDGRESGFTFQKLLENLRP